MKTSEVLYAAADHLESHGWMSMSHLPAGQPEATCAYVAIGRVTGWSGAGVDRAFWTYIGGTCASDIWVWNDAPERTAAEVVEALRACAVIEAAKESVDDREAVTA